VPYFNAAGVSMAPDPRGLAFLATAMAMATSSVDRLSDIPARLALLFDFDPGRALADPQLRGEISTPGARAVVDALAEELGAAPRVDREKFREIANRVKARTSQKSKALFHPIRIVLTGRAEGPELDLAVPTIDLGAELPASAGIPKIVGNRERAAAFARSLGEHG
jgi:glutamyl/glutaminyl-tRNA synthetase